jgi:hypothetical protein
MANDLTDEDFSVIEDHAQALGLLCIYWATLDNALFGLLAAYLNSDPVGLAVRAPDVSTLCEQIRKLAHVSGPDGEWRECLIRILNMIQGELAETRNRYVHDDWEISAEGMTRIDRRPKLQKPQAFQQVQLISNFKTVVPVEWVRQLTGRVVEAMQAIAYMTLSLRLWRGGHGAKLPPTALELSNCTPLAELRQPSKAKRKRPPRSSRR